MLEVDLNFNLVSWDFLSYMMKRMGFCTKWIKWINGCLKSISISILVNGSPTDEFSFSFNIVAKGLAGLMREAQD